MSDAFLDDSVDYNLVSYCTTSAVFGELLDQLASLERYA